MNRLLRTAHIERLLPSIEAMGPGPPFETFGTRLLAQLLDAPLLERGVSVRGMRMISKSNKTTFVGLHRVRHKRGLAGRG